jgi:hypothetical protein
MPSISPEVVAPGGGVAETTMKGGRRTRGATVKQMKRMLKKAGLKTTGKKASLTKRAKKAHLKIRKGGADSDMGVVTKDGEKLTEEVGGRRRRSRKSRGFKLF